jgi:hypothetical protein
MEEALKIRNLLQELSSRLSAITLRCLLVSQLVDPSTLTTLLCLYPWGSGGVGSSSSLRDRSWPRVNTMNETSVSGEQGHVVGWYAKLNRPGDTPKRLAHNFLSRMIASDATNGGRRPPGAPGCGPTGWHRWRPGPVASRPRTCPTCSAPMRTSWRHTRRERCQQHQHLAWPLADHLAVGGVVDAPALPLPVASRRRERRLDREVGADRDDQQ